MSVMVTGTLSVMNAMRKESLHFKRRLVPRQLPEFSVEKDSREWVVSKASDSFSKCLL